MRDRIRRGVQASSSSPCCVGMASCFTGCLSIMYSVLCLSGGQPTSASSPELANADSLRTHEEISRSTTSVVNENNFPVPTAPPLGDAPGAGNRPDPEATIRRIPIPEARQLKLGYGDREPHILEQINAQAHDGEPAPSISDVSQPHDGAAGTSRGKAAAPGPAPGAHTQQHKPP